MSDQLRIVADTPDYHHKRARHTRFDDAPHNEAPLSSYDDYVTINEDEHHHNDGSRRESTNQEGNNYYHKNSRQRSSYRANSSRNSGNQDSWGSVQEIEHVLMKVISSFPHSDGQTQIPEKLEIELRFGLVINHRFFSGVTKSDFGVLRSVVETMDFPTRELHDSTDYFYQGPRTSRYRLSFDHQNQFVGAIVKTKLQDLNITASDTPYDCRISVSSEMDQLQPQTPQQPPNGYVLKRHKTRHSYGHPKNAWKIDLTEVTSNDVAKAESQTTYEVEFEIVATALPMVMADLKGFSEDLWNNACIFMQLLQKKRMSFLGDLGLARLPSSSSTLAMMRKRVLEHYRQSSPQSPVLATLPQPNFINLRRKHINDIVKQQYHMMPQAQGVQYKLFVCINKDNTHDECTVYLIDERFEFYRFKDKSRLPDIELLSRIFEGDTLLLGEVVRDANGAPHYTISDALLIDGQNIAKLDLSKRLHSARERVVEPYQSVMMMGGSTAAVMGLSVKPIFGGKSAESIANHLLVGSDGETYFKVDGNQYPIDGLVIAIANHTFFQQPLYIWKYSHKRTAFFKVYIHPLVPRNYLDCTITLACLSADEGSEVVYEPKASFSSDDQLKMLYDLHKRRDKGAGAVVECWWDNHSSVWKYTHIRSDVFKPSTLVMVKEMKDIAIEDITWQEMMVLGDTPVH